MLYLETVESHTLGLLKKLMTRPYLNQFSLVGGTALSLQLGHRKSVDLDLFTGEDFDAEILYKQLSQDFETSEPKIKFKQTLILEVNGVKIDLIRFKYPFIRPMIEPEGIRMLQVEDIAPMKLDALSARGAKKDFYDIFFLLRQFTLARLFELYDEKYQHATVFHVIRSLTYFDDAEEDFDPYVFDPAVTWPLVKTTIENAVRAL